MTDAELEKKYGKITDRCVHCGNSCKDVHDAIAGEFPWPGVNIAKEKQLHLKRTEGDCPKCNELVETYRGFETRKPEFYYEDGHRRTRWPNP